MFTVRLRTNTGEVMVFTFDTLAEARAWTLRWTRSTARRYPVWGAAATIENAGGDVVGRYGAAR